jgi:hypothetical protein
MTQHAVEWEKVGKFGMRTKKFSLDQIRQEIRERAKRQRKRLLRGPQIAANERASREAEIARMQEIVRAKTAREEAMHRLQRLERRSNRHMVKWLELANSDDASLLELKVYDRKLKKIEKKIVELKKAIQS